MSAITAHLDTSADAADVMAHESTGQVSIRIGGLMVLLEPAAAQKLVNDAQDAVDELAGMTSK